MISDGKECLITLHLTNQTKQIPKSLSIQIPRNLSLHIPRNLSIQIPWNFSIELAPELRNTRIMLCHTFSWSVPFDTILFKVFALFRNFSVCNLSKVYTLNLRQTTNKTYQVFCSITDFYQNANIWVASCQVFRELEFIDDYILMTLFFYFVVDVNVRHIIRIT